MIKQKSKTFIIFFTIFFIGQSQHCNSTFLFLEKQIILTFFCFYQLFFYGHITLLYYTHTHTYANTNSFFIIQIQRMPAIFTGIINIYILISLFFAFFFSYYYIIFHIILISEPVHHATKVEPKPAI